MNCGAGETEPWPTENAVGVHKTIAFSQRNERGTAALDETLRFLLLIVDSREKRRFSGGVKAPEAPRVWDVGVRIASAIRRFSGRPFEDGTVPGSHASPRPHVRSAHWHTYWTGPRDAVFPLKKPVMRWILPLPIGMDWKRELPTNIRVVGG